MARRLRAFVRLREAVAGSTEPQLQRGRSDDEDELEESVSQAERDEAVRSGDAFPDGKYPIRTQKQANNAWKLRNNSKDHSEASVVAHIRKQVKKHGLEMPGGDETREADEDETTDDVEPKAKRSKKRKGRLATRDSDELSDQVVAMGTAGRPARESMRFRLDLREAVSKDGSAYEATLLREGPGNAQDSNYYTADALRQAVSDGLFEGAHCYADHPTANEERERPERSVRHLIGHFREARFVSGSPAEVRAKFTPVQGPGYEWVSSLIESALGSAPGKPLVGLSIDGEGHTDGEKTVAGRKYSLVRRITHLGSVDLVTRAGAGGRFHRRLSESLAGARASVIDAPELSARQVQERLRGALGTLEDGLAAQDEATVAEAFVALHEAARATVKPPKADAAKLQEAKDRARKAERRRDLAESTLERAKTAGRLLREVNVPPDTRTAWYDELTEQPDEPAMRTRLARLQTQRRDTLAELRESMGLDRVEGVPRREPAGPAAAPGSGLLAVMGIDPDDLERAA